MTRSIILIFLFTANLLTSCGQTEKKPFIDKNSIALDRIDKVEIIKRAIPPDTDNYKTKTLSNEQTQSFVNSWNRSNNGQLCKYLPAYILTVYLKHGALRQFRVGGKYIKENNDYCLDFEEENFFMDLYTKANNSIDKTDSTLNTGWYYITNNTTNYPRQLDKTFEYYYIDPNIIVPVKHFNKMEVTANKYPDGKYALLTIRFDRIGSDNWSIATEKAIGGRLALIINDKLVIAPQVNDQIVSGVSAINRSDYSLQELNEIMITIEKEKNK